MGAGKWKLGIVFQDFQLLTDRTVHENLKFVLKATGWKNPTEIERRIEEVLQQVGMENKGYKMPNELSGGEQQRIVIARAILNKPEIILAWPMNRPAIWTWKPDGASWNYCRTSAVRARPF